MTVGLVAGESYLEALSEEAQRVGAHPFAATALEAIQAYLADRGMPTTASPVPDAKHHDGYSSSEPPGLAEPLHRPAGDVVVNGVHVTLTERELDVLGQLALGSSYHEIGLALYITENTVKTHLASLYRKLGVERKSAALRVARSLGLL